VVDEVYKFLRKHMKYKNVFVTFLLVAGLLVVASLAMAEESSGTSSDAQDNRTMRKSDDTTSDSTSPGALKQKRTEIMKNIQDIKDKTEDKRNSINQLKKELGGVSARIVDGVVTAVNGSTLTVKGKEKIYTVTTDSNTKCVMRFFGTCTVAQILVNHKVNVFGSFTDDARTTILAKEIRNASLMKKWGTFMGNVTSKGTDSFVIESKERGNQTVTVSSTTKFIQRNEKASSFADMLVGHRVRVKGVWDKANNTVTEVTEVKNFSLPVKVPHMPPAATSPEPTTSGTAQ
jgi:hypothetical protein